MPQFSHKKMEHGPSQHPLQQWEPKTSISPKHLPPPITPSPGPPGVQSPQRLYVGLADRRWQIVWTSPCVPPVPIHQVPPTSGPHSASPPCPPTMVHPSTFLPHPSPHDSGVKDHWPESHLTQRFVMTCRGLTQVPCVLLQHHPPLPGWLCQIRPCPWCQQAKEPRLASPGNRVQQARAGDLHPSQVRKITWGRSY